jgi:hypothetical protein
MENEKKKDIVITKSFKKAQIQNCINSEDLLRGIENPDFKVNLGKCLNDKLFTH